jgi:hypothetical protein
VKKQNHRRGSAQHQSIPESLRSILDPFRSCFTGPRFRNFTFLVLARLYRSPKRCPEAEYKKRTEIAREMVLTLSKWLPGDRHLHLTGDREYACKTVLRGLDPGIEFTGPMPMDALLYGPRPRYKGRGRPRLRGKRLPSPKRRAADPEANWRRVKLTLYGRRTELLVQTWTCLWYTATG